MDPNSGVPGSAPEGQARRRSRRPATSCTLCHKRKVRCSRARPCSNCLRSKSGASGCVYEDEVPIPSQTDAPSLVSSRGQSQYASNRPGARATSSQSHETQNQALELKSSSSSNMSRSNSAAFTSLSSSLATGSWTQAPKLAAAGGQSSHGSEALMLQRRTQSLGTGMSNQSQSLASRSPAPPSATDSEVNTICSHLGGTFHIHSARDASSGQNRPAIAHRLSSKTRLFGQSHWVVTTAPLIQDLFNILERYEGNFSTNWTVIDKCKALARYIKARRTPAWPPPPNSKLPSKDVADALVENYLCTTESIYRILHLPTFRRQYEALWVNDTTPDPGFLIQLKLVLAIGAVTYDDDFSLRTSAILWVYEAQVWLAEPNFKPRLNIQTLQTNLLHLVAQEQVGVAGDSTWILSGTILRKAMQMGLHIDPGRLPGRSAYDAEMRRRLWNTVIELNLQASLTCGGAPLISLSDFDTAAPGNFDEEQLEADGPTARPPTEFTQVSIAVALRQTFPQRLAVVKFLNGLRVSPGTYDETLRIDAELREAFKALSKTLRAACGSPYSRCRNARSEIQLVDFLMQRYLTSLHAPYFSTAHGTAYAYSQKAVVECSLRVWRAAYRPSSLQPQNCLRLKGNAADANAESEFDLPRLATCSSGFYQTATFHAALLIALELRSQLQDEDECSLLGPTPLRPDLMSVLEEARAWCLRVIETGKTNVKGYLLMSLVAAQVSGMMRSMEEDEAVGELIKAVKAVEEKCLPVLVNMAEELEREATGVEAIDELPAPMEMEQGMDDWALSWVFNDDVNPGDLMF